MKEKNYKIFLLFFFIISELISSEFVEIKNILRTYFNIKDLKNCNYVYIENFKKKFHNQCVIEIKKSEIIYKFRIHSEEFNNLVLLKQIQNQVEIYLELNDLKQNKKFLLVQDKVLSEKDRKIYTYFDNKTKKFIQIDFIKGKKIILILEYGKFEIIF